MNDKLKDAMHVLSVAAVYLMCAAFVAEHIYIIVKYQTDPPQLVEACPVSRATK